VGGGCRKVDLQVARLKKNDFQNLGGVNHILNIEVACRVAQARKRVPGNHKHDYNEVRDNSLEPS